LLHFIVTNGGIDVKRSKKEIGKKVGTPPGTLIYTGDKREEMANSLAV